MSDTENQTLDQALDPPDNQGGTKAALNFDSTSTDPTPPIDPPENSGGTGG
jgi:hypothetical protein